MILKNNTFINNSAVYDGGAIYSSVGTNIIENNTFISNSAISGNGGAIYCLDCISIIKNSNFTGNNAGMDGDAVYNYDSSLTCTNTYFKNNGRAIYDVYNKNVLLENNTYISDHISVNNTDYETYVLKKGIGFNLTGNDINVTNLPSRFDSREWGWVSPIKNQGTMGSCWAFSVVGAVESALLKFTGMSYDISENNVQDLMLKFSKYGDDSQTEGGKPYTGMQYLLSWLGAFSTDFDTYDEYGKISSVFLDENIHIQDILQISPSEQGALNLTDEIKKGILKCGALSIAFNSNGNAYNEEYASYYNDDEMGGDHAVTVIGWDDNFSKDNFINSAPANGAWICKNSWGTNWGKDGFFYISYYDKSLDTTSSFGVIIENNITYNKNYQTDFGGRPEFDTNVLKYYNNYQSKGNDFLAAVGTYFKNESINYTMDIYVNGQLKHTQNGTSKYRGYSTIKLDKYVSLHENDNFSIHVNGNCLPLIKNSVHSSRKIHHLLILMEK